MILDDIRNCDRDVYYGDYVAGNATRGVYLEVVYTSSRRYVFELMVNNISMISIWISEENGLEEIDRRKEGNEYGLVYGDDYRCICESPDKLLRVIKKS